MKKKAPASRTVIREYKNLYSTEELLRRIIRRQLELSHAVYHVKGDY